MAAPLMADLLPARRRRPRPPAPAPRLGVAGERVGGYDALSTRLVGAGNNALQGRVSVATLWHTPRWETGTTQIAPTERSVAAPTQPPGTPVIAPTDVAAPVVP